MIRVGRVALRFLDWWAAVVAVCRVERIERFIGCRTEGLVLIDYRGVKRTKLINPDARMRISKNDSVRLIGINEFCSRKRAFGNLVTPLAIRWAVFR